MSVSGRIQQWFSFAALCGVLGVTGCSAARPPVAQIAQADLAVRQATESKAATHASSEFRVAQEKMVEANRAMAAEEYELARRLAEQAVIDAQLAQARANAAEAQKNVQEVRSMITALQSEAERTTTP
jgi:regulator of replication initiation timing